ncbi:MAG: L-lactate dehydrogenase complex protein LldF [Acidimicrobiia bacterium]|nr:L-lactate dehydrogenase complex protein LldF [Acidimicrobiia bacterium]
MSHDLLTGTTLRNRTAKATADLSLRSTLQYVTDRLATSGVAGAGLLDNWEELRDAARAQRAQIISRLPEILAQLADRWEANGGRVFWAADAEEARGYISEVVSRRQAKRVVKSKSMATEEIGLNDALESQGVEVVETDLGEWIIQLADQPPSHIIAPAIHLTRDDVRDIFNREPASAGALSNVPEELCAFAREQLREKFLTADVGISGCNMAVAETGSMVLVTNEGNGRMVTSLPPVHIAVMGMERVVETWEQLDLILALLPRAATGQDLSVYTTQVTGPRRPGEIDGPEELHLVILDNGRSELIGGEFQEMLNCIRCGACLNVCPVYRQVGGHAYGWCYSGPMGAVLIPLLNRAEEAGELSGASTLCGACYDACPVKIPLQDLLLALRRKRVDEEATRAQRVAWKTWATAWSHPQSYRASTAAAARVGRVLPTRLFPHAWAAGREIPRARTGPSFRQRLARGEI